MRQEEKKDPCGDVTAVATLRCWLDSNGPNINNALVGARLPASITCAWFLQDSSRTRKSWLHVDMYGLDADGETGDVPRAANARPSGAIKIAGRSARMIDA